MFTFVYRPGRSYNMSVTVKDLVKDFDGQKAVDGISFSIGKGEVTGFLGPNGAGKSSTMKILACFQPQSSGFAEVAGFDVVKNSMDVRKRVGYLPEQNPLYPDMYVREYLEFVASLHQLGKQSKQRVEAMIEQTGLGPERTKKIGQLSKGYRQRLGLAQAMIHDPEVLILDEPTSGLDPNQLAEIRKLIIEAGKDKTVILSTHIMQEVQAVCQRVLIINQGKLVADAPIGQLQKRMKGGVVTVVGLKEKADKKLFEAIEGIEKVSEGENNSWHLFGKQGFDPREEVFRLVKEKGLTLLTLQQEEQSLEEVFRKLTTNDNPSAA